MEDFIKLKEQLCEAEKQLRDSKLHLADLTDFIENAALPLHWVNGSGIIVWANKAELDLVGYTAEEYIGRHISNFHAERVVCEDILDRLIRKETLKNYMAVLKHKNGDRISVLINSNVRWDGDKFIHTRCFTRDISDLKKADTTRVDLINELQALNNSLKEENRMLKKVLGVTEKKL